MYESQAIKKSDGWPVTQNAGVRLKRQTQKGNRAILTKWMSFFSTGARLPVKRQLCHLYGGVHTEFLQWTPNGVTFVPYKGTIWRLWYLMFGFVGNLARNSSQICSLDIVYYYIMIVYGTKIIGNKQNKPQPTHDVFTKLCIYTIIFRKPIVNSDVKWKFGEQNRYRIGLDWMFNVVYCLSNYINNWIPTIY